jgi:hypothetical protein
MSGRIGAPPGWVNVAGPGGSASPTPVAHYRVAADSPADLIERGGDTGVTADKPSVPGPWRAPKKKSGEHFCSPEV